MTGERLRLTQQSVDPVASVATWGLAIGHVGLAAVGMVVAVAAHSDEVVGPVLAAMAIGFTVAAAVSVIVWTSPRLAPMSNERLWVVMALALGAAIAESASTAGANQLVSDDAGPVVVGLMLVSLAPYCTWQSLLTACGVSAGILGILTLESAQYSTIDAPLPAFVVVAALPVLVLGAAAAGYSRAVVDEVLAFDRRAAIAVLSRDREVRAGIARTVQEGRVTVLGRDVLPLLAEVTRTGQVTPAQADRARELAHQLRSALVEGADATWLDDLVGVELGRGTTRITLDDPHGAASRLPEAQRATVAAVVAWLSGGQVTSDALELRVHDDPPGCLVAVTATGVANRPGLRTEAQNFLGVVRVSFDRAELRLGDASIHLELAYAG
ncbi:hypothetical protein ARHIZOSPH14_04390 [Agromyces rhizosphaerae]|uniref:Uncharacterized protein n=1 Tax=Agromyces rhizosphaerae TaxID=88374 RepID=A0A9W6CVV6_9MICO|nr:hypothetical protein [Agromyces rhizosphaerae]GLI26197.1 hypothetical protein ARHIZOSPH14_04390 [Agromyces rhizosphaerae]